MNLKISKNLKNNSKIGNNSKGHIIDNAGYKLNTYNKKIKGCFLYIRRF